MDAGREARLTGVTDAHLAARGGAPAVYSGGELQNGNKWSQTAPTPPQKKIKIKKNPAILKRGDTEYFSKQINIMYECGSVLRDGATE